MLRVSNVRKEDQLNYSIRNDVDVNLKWLDRLKVLFGYTICVDTTIYCENSPGKHARELTICCVKMHGSK